MGDFLRCEDMALCQIFIPFEASHYVISELGEHGLVQFKDLNQGVQLLQRYFAKDVLRCYDMERKLKSIAIDVRAKNIEIFTNHATAQVKLASPNELTALWNKINQAEEEINKLKRSSDSLKLHLIRQLEFKNVLLRTEEFLKQRDSIFGPTAVTGALDFLNIPGLEGMNIFTGVIDKARTATFEKLVWRLSKRNAFMKTEDIQEPIIDKYTGRKYYKSVFIICSRGDQLMTKIIKLCNGFQASLFTCPSDETERQNYLETMDKRLSELELITDQTDAQLRKYLISVGNQWQTWTVKVTKAKAVYHTLNNFNVDVTGKCLVGECWIPVTDIPQVRQILEDGAKASCSAPAFFYILKTKETPPTFHRTNKYTQAFQHIINVYGTSSYKETNPALYSLVTFPFLFAVMFGDMGHATIMICFALYLISIEKALTVKIVKSEVVNIFFAGRYMILAMGMFSFYTGFVYNEFFSKPVNLFGSSWFTNFSKKMVDEMPEISLDPSLHFVDAPYPFGIDPIWGMANNLIIFSNSYKMKMSIIIGVSHMLLGLCINLINYRYFHTMIDLFLEFLPRIILLCCLFLWLVILMFVKWIMYSAKSTDVRYGTACAPSILVCFIDMMLFKETSPQHKECKAELFDNQNFIEKIIIAVAAVTVPIMLLGKPIHVLIERKVAGKKNTKNNKEPQPEFTTTQTTNISTNINEGNSIADSQNLEIVVENKSLEMPVVIMKSSVNMSFASFKESSYYDENEEEVKGMGEVILMQAIDTIEYALGTISHTASYLRLWALSLAHNQLSEVLWDRVFRIGLAPRGYKGGFIMFISFLVWMTFTTLILVVMEGLSAFLHTLRLHWVEFMSKFYQGLGTPFNPLHFKKILEEKY